MTFNEILQVHDINPAQVAVLRHTGQRGPLGFTPYDLWRRQDGSFDRYQSTQARNKPLFEKPFWASFVAAPNNETLFVGLYGVAKGDSSEIDWLCPMTDKPPGYKGGPSDLYHIVALEALSEYRGNLEIGWDAGYVSWARYALRSDHAVLGEVDIQPFARFEASPEGEATWHSQRTVERDPKLAKAALQKNADDHDGHFACEACGFTHAVRAMFDVHHLHPLLSGPRMTRVSDLAVLCPMCHRRAHCSPSRMVPFDLAALQEWNATGRP